MSFQISKTALTMIAIVLTTVASAQSPVNTEEQQIRNNVANMETGWNTKNGKLFSTSFAEIHDYIVWNGYYFPNQSREMNARAHQGLFDGPYRNTDLMLKVDQVKFLRDDLALVHVMGSTYEKGSAVPKNPGVIISMVMEKKEGSWLITSFHNCDLEAFTNQETADRSPMPLNVMYAGWFKN